MKCGFKKCDENAVGFYSDGYEQVYRCQEHAWDVLKDMEPGETRAGINVCFQKFRLEPCTKEHIKDHYKVKT